MDMHEPPPYPTSSLEWEEQLRAGEEDNPDGYWWDFGDADDPE